MKVPPDISSGLIANYIEQTGFLRKFIKYWGTMELDGEEVLVDRRGLHKDHWGAQFQYAGGSGSDDGLANATIEDRESMDKFAKLLGQYDEWYNIDKGGAKRVWLRMRPPIANEDLDTEEKENLARLALKNTFNSLFKGLNTSRSEYEEEFGESNIANPDNIDRDIEYLYADLIIGHKIIDAQPTAIYSSHTVSSRLIDKIVPPSFVNSTAQQEALKNEIVNSYQDIWDQYVIRTGGITVSSTDYYMYDSTGTPFQVLSDVLENAVSTVFNKEVRYNLASELQKPAEMLIRYALFSNLVNYEIVNISKSLETFTIPYRTYANTSDDDYSTTTKYYRAAVNSYVVRIKMPYQQFSEDSDLIDKIIEHAKVPASSKDLLKPGGFIDNSLITRRGVYGMPYYVEDCDYDNDCTKTLVQPEFSTWVQNHYKDRWICRSSNNGMFGIKGCPYIGVKVRRTSHSDMQYLKVSFLEDSSIPLQERINYLLQSIDSGYSEYHTSALEKLAGFVLVIVAVAFCQACVSAAGAVVASLYIAGVALTIALAVGIAVFISLVAVALNLVAALTMYLGFEGAAMTVMSFMKAVAPLIQVANIISVVASIYIAIQKLAQEGVKLAGKEAGKEVSKQATVKASEMSLAEFASNVIKGIKAEFRNIISFDKTNISFNKLMKMFNMTFNLYKKNELKKLEDRNRDLRAANEEAEAEEADRTRNLLLDSIKHSSRPLQALESRYAELYDRPYEWWSTSYHTGNMQANKVKANRFSEDATLTNVKLKCGIVV